MSLPGPVVVLVVEPLPGESAARGFGPGFDVLTAIDSERGDALLDPSELDLEWTLLAPDRAFLAATFANSCIRILFCSVSGIGNGMPDVMPAPMPDAAARAAAAKSLPMVTSALPYIWARTKSTASRAEVLDRRSGDDMTLTLTPEPVPFVELVTFEWDEEFDETDSLLTEVVIVVDDCCGCASMASHSSLKASPSSFILNRQYPV